MFNKFYNIHIRIQSLHVYLFILPFPIHKLTISSTNPPKQKEIFITPQIYLIPPTTNKKYSTNQKNPREYYPTRITPKQTISPITSKYLHQYQEILFKCDSTIRFTLGPKSIFNFIEEKGNKFEFYFSQHTM